jgi:quinol monooxygenase YgiN
MSVFIVATYTTRPDTVDDVAHHLAQMVAPTRAEPGCHAYQVFRSRDDGTVFVLVEEYEDEAAIEAHRAGAHFETHILNGAIPLLAQRSVVIAEPLS